MMVFDARGWAFAAREWIFAAGGWLVGSVALCACLLPAGCGKPDLDKMVDQGLQQVSERMEGVKEEAQDVRNRVERQVSEQLGRAKDTVNAQVGEGGRVQLQLEPALEVNTCFAEFLRFPDARRSVVQFRTYREAETETFPSVFVRCLTQATDPAELSGVTLEAENFVQREAGGEVLYTRAPAQLAISQVDERLIVARILGGTLQRSGSNETVSVTGEVEGRLDR